MGFVGETFDVDSNVSSGMIVASSNEIKSPY